MDVSFVCFCNSPRFCAAMSFHFLTRSRWRDPCQLVTQAVPIMSQMLHMPVKELQISSVLNRHHFHSLNYNLLSLFHLRFQHLSWADIQDQRSLLVTNAVESTRFLHPEQSLIVESTPLYLQCHHKVLDHWLPHFQQSRYQMKNQLVEGGVYSSLSSNYLILFLPMLSTPIDSILDGYFLNNFWKR